MSESTLLRKEFVISVFSKNRFMLCKHSELGYPYPSLAPDYDFSHFFKSFSAKTVEGPSSYHCNLFRDGQLSSTIPSPTPQTVCTFKWLQVIFLGVVQVNVNLYINYLDEFNSFIFIITYKFFVHYNSTMDVEHHHKSTNMSSVFHTFKSNNDVIISTRHKFE